MKTMRLPACPGWLSARRDVVLDDGPKWCAVYEAAGEWACTAPEFEAVRGFMDFNPTSATSRG